MNKKALALTYRPKTLNDVVEQDYIKIILNNQIINKDIQNAYLFCGSSGCGKTTVARIFANMINENKGNPIEVDGASNNGVENVRNIINDAKLKSIESEYKIYIIDEVHMLSIGAFNALLKTLEEPPVKTIFILCTTHPEKIPLTILSRVQRFDFTKISYDSILNRLKYIIDTEKKQSNMEFSYDIETLKYITKLSNGGMRSAISLLDKCLTYDNNLTIKSVSDILGLVEYDIYFQLLQSIIDKKPSDALLIIDNINNSSIDIKYFVQQFLYFIIDILKYKILKSHKYIKIPICYSEIGNYYEQDSKLKYLLDSLLDLNNKVKYADNSTYILEAYVLNWINDDVC